MSDQAFIPGDVVHLKVSGEQVVVLNYHNGSNLYEVRRCVHRKLKGNAYTTESYYAFELESAADHNLKRLKDMEDIAAALKGAGVAVLNDKPAGPTKPPTTNYDNKPN